MRQHMVVLLVVVVITISSCGWHSRCKKMPDQVKAVVFDSSDPNGPLSRAIRTQLLLHGVKLVEKDSLRQDMTLFRLLTSELMWDTESLFQDGHTAEYRIVMSVDVDLVIPSYGIYPISVRVHRTFSDNSEIALAKDVEKHLIINEIYDKVAEELILKLFNIQLVNATKTNSLNRK